ncbi:MAG TPA: DNA mismatch repair endonuclease MutL [Candidatus Omnitrophota bacterium]|nr:DNA mismatch repair endonuclease MutL [Candidatus Omnitrophota bacterium]
MSKGIIHVLPETVANKIAAGEVVERPASVVKELVENSLDAGAASVEIEIAHGGKSLIRVSDDGNGMNRTDAELAFLRHATSKILEVEDLQTIQSFGFRGEALPSIAAVSRVKLVTGFAGELAGTEIQIEGGIRSAVSDCPVRAGTLIEVRDLFFNTPARRKFLKSDAVEMGHILDMVSNVAFANLSVRFSLKSGNRVLLDLPPAQTAMERARFVFGEEPAKHLLEMEGESKGIRFTGLIGKPFISRANRSGQVFFVNRRWVRALSLGYALQDGFYGLLMDGKYPVAVVFLEADPEWVDVNVHPTKQEVKLSHESEIKSLLRKIVTDRLMKEQDLVPALQLRLGQPKIFGKETAQPVEFTLREEAHSVRDSGGGYFSGDVSSAAETISLKEKFQITRVLGQVHNTFVVAETEEGFLLVDQHAAHERIVFEAFSKNFRSENPERQTLLMDEILEIHPKQTELFKQLLPSLRQVGFEIEPFGETSFIIRSYPAVLKEAPAVFIKSCLEQREEGKIRTSADNQTDEIAALIACKKKSVKAHDALRPEAVWALLQKLAQCENPFSCPHGRPTFLKFTVADLEKQFKRK